MLLFAPRTRNDLTRLQYNCVSHRLSIAITSSFRNTDEAYNDAGQGLHYCQPSRQFPACCRAIGFLIVLVILDRQSGRNLSLRTSIPRILPCILDAWLLFSKLVADNEFERAMGIGGMFSGKTGDIGFWLSGKKQTGCMHTR